MDLKGLSIPRSSTLVEHLPDFNLVEHSPKFNLVEHLPELLDLTTQAFIQRRPLLCQDNVWNYRH